MTPAEARPRPPRRRLQDLGRDPQLSRILLQHASRGIRVQLLLRGALVVFVAVTVLAVPPTHDEAACLVVAGAYAAWAVGVAWLDRAGGDRVAQFMWMALFVDLLALAALTVLASESNTETWTADILVNGFFVIPMLATAQLRPSVSIAVTLPTVAVYFASSAASRHANGEPWSSVALRTAVLAALSAAGVVLSAVQRSRVLTIAELVSERTALVSELGDVEGQARRLLAEELHDGALQYVLAARLDLEDARARGDAESWERVDFALRESTDLLRSKVTQLHPAVLEQAGLLRALEELVESTGSRGGLSAELDASGWDESRRTPADDLLYSAARELLSNVTRHARATSVVVTLSGDDEWTRLDVADDGVGLVPGVLEQRLAEGHIGLASQRVRVEAAGGHLRLRPRDPGPGTLAEVEVPSSVRR